jgi:toxin-antitoxin system PIN domain toxin
MIDLPDVNVWLALVDENHIHHASAQRYWQHQAAASVAFCRVSMLGFLRLATHRKVLSRPLSPAEAWHIYQQYLDEPDVRFVPETSFVEREFQVLTRLPGFSPPLWTDAYLAAFAQTAGCRIVSFDSDFQRFPSLDFLHLKIEDETKTQQGRGGRRSE